VFSNDTVSGMWNETQILKPENAGTENSCFGSAVALNSEWAAVGAPYGGDDGKGGVYVFGYSDSTRLWVEHSFFKAPNDVTSQFGVGVSINGDVIAVSAGGETSADGRAGYVFLYEYENSDGEDEWNKIEDLETPKSTGNPVPIGQIAFNGDAILVGSLSK
jgi:hypothetical protein